jgi:hypothetical protein
MSQNARCNTGLWDATFGWYLLLSFLWNIGLGVFPPLLPQIMTDLELTHFPQFQEETRDLSMG